MTSFQSRRKNYKPASNSLLVEVCGNLKNTSCKALFLEDKELNTFKELRRFGVEASNMVVPNPDENLCGLISERGVNVHCGTLYEYAAEAKEKFDIIYMDYCSTPKTGPLEDIGVVVPLMQNQCVVGVTLCQRKVGRIAVFNYYERLRKACAYHGFTLVDIIGEPRVYHSMMFNVFFAVKRLAERPFTAVVSVSEPMAEANTGVKTRSSQTAGSDIALKPGDYIEIASTAWSDYDGGPWSGVVLFAGSTIQFVCLCDVETEEDKQFMADLPELVVSLGGTRLSQKRVPMQLHQVSKKTAAKIIRTMDDSIFNV